MILNIAFVRKDMDEKDILQYFKDGLTYFMRKAKDSLEVPGELMRFLKYPSAPNQDGPLIFLGKTYPGPCDISFLNGPNYAHLRLSDENLVNLQV